MGDHCAADAGAGAVWPPARRDDVRRSERYLLRPTRRHRIAADPEGVAATLGYFARWRDARLFARINHELIMADRERVRRELTHGYGAQQPQRQDDRERRSAWLWRRQ